MSALSSGSEKDSASSVRATANHIFFCERQLTCGEIIIPPHLTVHGNFVTPQPLRIIREATREEYLAQNPEERAKLEALGYLCFFYEISTD